MSSSSTRRLRLAGEEFRAALRRQLASRDLHAGRNTPSDPRLIHVELPQTAEEIERPTPIIGSDLDRLIDRIETSVMLAQIESQVGAMHFRGVPDDKLGAVLATGIDVEPATAPFFSTAFLRKALEYGGHPKVIITLRADALDRTFRDLPATTPPEELASLMKTFPSRFDLDGGARIWLSRFGTDTPYTLAGYESEYGHWIPGDARAALLAVLRLEAER